MYKIQRGDKVPGDGPAEARGLLSDFAEWYRNNYGEWIPEHRREAFIYDQWMLTPPGEGA